MNAETKRVTIKGLRGSDVATLQVLTQDVISLPLNQIHPATACDLFAIAEVSDQVPEQLARDLSSFVDRVTREMGDLSGANFSDYGQGILGVNAEFIPDTFRAVVETVDAPGDVAEGLMESLSSHFETAAALPYEVSQATSLASKAAASRGAAKAPPKARTKVVSKDDSERKAWVADFVVSRLVNYETGIKESLLVGAVRHKAPWNDFTDREVRSILRAMAREGKLKTSVGRWSLNR